MPVFSDDKDAFGHSIYDYYMNKEPVKHGLQIVERDDGYIGANNVDYYFSDYRHWIPYEKKAMKYARGRVLDIGSGGGRHSLYLQEKGLDVVALDNSPLGLEVCKQRGIRNTWLTSIKGIDKSAGIFDTIIMLGQNFGLFEEVQTARKLLDRFDRLTSPKAVIITDSADPHQTTAREHLEYHQSNRDRGRLPGQVRIRVRYNRYCSPWFEYLKVSKPEMEMILEGTNWQVKRYIDWGESAYVAIIQKSRRK